MKKVNQIIGLADFRTGDEVYEISHLFSQYNNNSSLKLMVTVATNFKILCETEIKSDWDSILPKPENWKYIFRSSRGEVINCIHYSDANNNEDLNNSLSDLVRKCGPGLDSIILDVGWPNCEELNYFRQVYPQSLILQISKEMIRDRKNTPYLVAERIEDDYDNIISQILFEMDYRNPPNIYLMEDYIVEVRKKVPGIDIAICGFGPNSLSSAKELIKNYGISLYTHRKIHKEENLKEPINHDLAKTFLEKSIKFYK